MHLFIRLFIRSFNYLLNSEDTRMTVGCGINPSILKMQN